MKDKQKKYKTILEDPKNVEKLKKKDDTKKQDKEKSKKNLKEIKMKKLKSIQKELS